MCVRACVRGCVCACVLVEVCKPSLPIVYDLVACPSPSPSPQVLVLRELAVYSPTLFYQSIQQFFDNIYGAIRDPRVSTEAHGLLLA